MIKPIGISPINTTNHLHYECKYCGAKGEFVLENLIINVDNNGKIIEELDYECPECNKRL